MGRDIVNPRLVGVLRGVKEGLMPDTFALKLTEKTDDNAGGQTEVDSTVATGPCRLRSVTGADEQSLADRLTWITPYAIDVPVATAASPVNTIIVNDRTFQIGGVVDIGAWATKKTLICREVG